MSKILIAGSSSGIGRAIAEKLLAQNFQVIGLARQHDKFTPSTANYFTYAIDFSHIEQLEKQFAEVSRDHHDVDTLICSVGYGHFAELEQFSVKNMQEMLHVNFLSQVILIKTFLPDFKKQRRGKIILIGSEAALAGQKKGSLYCATKFAMRGFSQSLRKECSSAQVTVTLINPGFVDTPFFDDLQFRPATGENHTIQPQQVANLISLLMTEESNCVYEEINLQPMKKVIEKMTHETIVNLND